MYSIYYSDEFQVILLTLMGSFSLCLPTLHTVAHPRMRLGSKLLPEFFMQNFCPSEMRVLPLDIAGRT